MLSKLFVTNVAVTKPIPEDNYIANLPTVRNLRKMGGLSFHKPVTFFVGENGVGKSTLIERSPSKRVSTPRAARSTKSLFKIF